MSKYGFYFDMTSCIGCRTCQIACKDKNDLDIGITFRQVHSFEGGSYPNPILYHYAATCNHCEDPLCVANCPQGAMYIDDDGTVQHDAETCIGCMTCAKSCPYDIPQEDTEANIAVKCNMCQDLIEQGERPACVDACVMRALEWGSFDDLKAAHPDAVSDIYILPSSEQTKPCVLITPKKSALTEEVEPKQF